jgi:hypothetical protein
MVLIIAAKSAVRRILDYNTLSMEDTEPDMMRLNASIKLSLQKKNIILFLV